MKPCKSYIVSVGNVDQAKGCARAKCRHCKDVDGYIKFVVEKGILVDLVCPRCGNKLYAVKVS